MKNAISSPHDYLLALQKEFICMQIRRKIYVHENDKEYFGKLLIKKQASILTISSNHDINNIFDTEDLYNELWRSIVPNFGMPKFVYNIANVSAKQLSFPYKGTAVKFIQDGKVYFGITEMVVKNAVWVNFMGTSLLIDSSFVERLNHQETDEFFYYWPNEKFNLNMPDGKTIGSLSSYNMITKSAQFLIDGVLSVTFNQGDISRIF